MSNEETHPDCADSPDDTPECPNCGLRGKAAKLPHSCKLPAQPQAAEFTKEEIDDFIWPLRNDADLKSVRIIIQLRTQLKAATQPSIDFNKGWELARQGKPKDGLEDDELSGWKVFMYDELESQLETAQGEVERLKITLRKANDWFGVRIPNRPDRRATFVKVKKEIEQALKESKG